MPNQSKSKTKKTLSGDIILEWYETDVLEGKAPSNVYLFTKNHGIKENEFYRFFNSLEGIENHFFEWVFDQTLETLEKSKPYPGYSAKEKLLGFYYTFFGNLTNNRSFVLYLLKPGHPEKLKKLKGLRKKFINYFDSLEFEKTDLKHEKLNRVKDHAVKEAAWIQLLSAMRFWYRDDSHDFEKTDIFIEKLLTAGFDLIETKPLKSLTDLGKFIFKEMNPAY